MLCHYHFSRKQIFFVSIYPPTSLLSSDWFLTSFQSHKLSFPLQVFLSRTIKLIGVSLDHVRETRRPEDHRPDGRE